MPTLQEIAQAEVDWLLDQQDETSGGWGAQPGDDPSELNTAEAVLAVLEVRGDVLGPGAPPIAKAVDFLEKHQATGAHAGAWQREIHPDSGPVSAPDVLRTSLACQALIQAGRRVSEGSVAAAVRWLSGALTTAGLWGYGGRPDEAPALLPSSAALAALMDACANGAQGARPLVEQQLQRLVETFRHRDGSFGDGDLRAVHTMHAVLLFQKARNCRFPVLGEWERDGIDWLLEHSDDVFQDVEESVEIDPADPRINYSFVYVVESLFIKVLTDSQDARHRQSAEYRDAFLAVRKRRRRDGGFYGNRVFSWSTARSVTALWQARGERDELPDRRPDVNVARMAAVVVFALAIALIVAFVDKFEVVKALFYALLLLSVLLGVGALSEKGFVELFRSGLRGFRRGRSG